MCLCDRQWHISAVLRLADLADCSPDGLLFGTMQRTSCPLVLMNGRLCCPKQTLVELRHKCQPTHPQQSRGIVCMWRGRAGRVGDGHPAWITWTQVFQKSKEELIRLEKFLVISLHMYVYWLMRQKYPTLKFQHSIYLFPGESELPELHLRFNSG